MFDAFSNFDVKFVDQNDNKVYSIKLSEKNSPDSLHLLVLDDLNVSWELSASTEFVEEITKKAGNFKRFALFKKMLLLALSN
ncbi:hypothetical protein HK096_001436, partial [Nowakowskiella sp. JEL0078]